jgi:glycosyltransferase involved in cell wall biosynthesis
MSSSTGIILTTYASHAAQGRNLGSAGYSYDFVVRQFAPLLAQCGDLVEVPPELPAIEREAARLRVNGKTPVHFCFMPFQHAVLGESVPNVVVPAWEFPDVPDHAFDGEPRNNWVAMANRCAAVIVGGPWTADCFRRAGIHRPIHVVPVPTPAWNFELPRWSATDEVAIDCVAIDCRTPIAATSMSAPSGNGPQRKSKTSTSFHGTSLRTSIRSAARRTWREFVRPLLPPRVAGSFSAAVQAAAAAWQSHRGFPTLDRLALSGVVYTSIFNPEDGRKNWQDLVSAFLLALGDRPDATLVLKLVARNRRSADPVLAHYARLDLAHRCRLLVVTDFISREQMAELARGTTYYVTSTRAEGNCLPLMDSLAAGRPAISPSHTAISDYFGEHAGFVVESHPEPACWPQDSLHRCRTTWHRLVWTSLAEQLRRSYEIARRDAAAYERLSQQARLTMQAWSHPEVVAVRLRAAIEAVAAGGSQATDYESPAHVLRPFLRKAA